VTAEKKEMKAAKGAPSTLAAVAANVAPAVVEKKRNKEVRDVINGHGE
jgi:hypothetical protein